MNSNEDAGERRSVVNMFSLPRLPRTYQILLAKQVLEEIKNGKIPMSLFADSGDSKFTDGLRDLVTDFTNQNLEKLADDDLVKIEIRVCIDVKKGGLGDLSWQQVSARR